MPLLAVGLIAGQWMQVLGAKSIGTAGNDEKCNLAKDHGYWETINYSNEDFLQRVQEITNQTGVDVVYDSVGNDTMFNSFKALKVTEQLLASVSHQVHIQIYR